MNSWNFTGHIPRDAEQRFTPQGDSIVSFSVAVKSGYGKNESTSWPNCSILGKYGESVLPYLKKGQLVGISGELNNRPYTDKEGNKRHSLDVRVNDLTLLGGKREEPHSSEHQQQKANGYQGESKFKDFNSDVPF